MAFLRVRDKFLSVPVHIWRDRVLKTSGAVPLLALALAITVEAGAGVATSSSGWIAGSVRDLNVSDSKAGHRLMITHSILDILR